MNTYRRLLALTLSGMCAVAQPQTKANEPNVAPAAKVSLAEGFSTMLGVVENQMMSLAKAMPPEKFGFAPSGAIFIPSQQTAFGGVRTFGELLVHVAQANYGAGKGIAGLAPGVERSELAKLTEKDHIVDALGQSFAYLRQSIATLTVDNVVDSTHGPFPGPMNRASQVLLVLGHAMDEYGQLVEYARMNGVVPPASEKKN